MFQTEKTLRKTNPPRGTEEEVKKKIHSFQKTKRGHNMGRGNYGLPKLGGGKRGLGGGVGDRNNSQGFTNPRKKEVLRRGCSQELRGPLRKGVSTQKRFDRLGGDRFLGGGS